MQPELGAPLCADNSFVYDCVGTFPHQHFKVHLRAAHCSSTVPPVIRLTCKGCQREGTWPMGVAVAGVTVWALPTAGHEDGHLGPHHHVKVTHLIVVG